MFGRGELRDRAWLCPCACAQSGEHSHCGGDSLLHEEALSGWAWRAQRLLRLAALVGLLPFAGAAFAESPLPPPPSPVPVAITVERGGQVVIRLKAGGRTPGPVRFLLRSPPMHGRLGEIRQAGRAEAEVVYHHGGGGEQSDSFRFAAQAADSPVSAAAEVRIMVKDPPARLEAGRPLDFGELAPGESRTLEARWKNAGGTAARLVVKAPAPFHVEVEPEAAPGQVARLPVTFAPMAEGQFSAELVPEGHPAARVRVVGRCRKPFSLEIPEPAEFENRQLPVTLFNTSAITRPIHVEWPRGRLWRVFPALAPGERAEFVLPWPVEGQSHAATLRVRSGAFSQEWEVRRQRPQPRLRGPERLDFGEVPAGGVVSRIFTLRNEGDAEAALSADLPAGLRMVPAVQEFRLPPGSAREFEAVFEAGSQSRGLSAELRICAAGGDVLRIPVSAKVAGEPSPSPAAREEPEVFPSPSLAETSWRHQPEPRVSWSEVLARPEGIRQIPSPPFFLRLAWPAVASAETYVVEARAIEWGGDDAPPLIRWNAWPRAKFRKKGNEIQADLPGALPRSLWFLRVRALDAAGRSSPPSATFQAAAPPAPLPWWVVLAAVAMGAAGGLAGFRVLQRRRQRRQLHERQRIARLENPHSS